MPRTTMMVMEDVTTSDQPTPPAKVEPDLILSSCDEEAGLLTDASGSRRELSRGRSERGKSRRVDDKAVGCGAHTGSLAFDVPQRSSNQTARSTVGTAVAQRRALASDSGGARPMKPHGVTGTVGLGRW